MATGAPGTNGVWQYGEDDSEATFSALLNKAASTTDTQIGADRARLTALESKAPGTAGQPYKQAAGKTLSNATAGSNAANLYWSAATTITFPVGRFNVAPIVTALYDAGTTVSWCFLSAVPTTTGFSVTPIRLLVYPASFYIYWTAVQMTATTAEG